MKQTIDNLKSLANRLKLVSMLAALFMSGALLSITVCSWYYDRMISKIHGSYGGRIGAYNKEIRRLKRQLDHEQAITRDQLDKLAADMAALLRIDETMCRKLPTDKD